MAADEVEVIRIKETAGVLPPITKKLNVPFSRIARMHGKENSRTISSIETGQLKTVGGAINLTMAAAQGRPFDGE